MARKYSKGAAKKVKRALHKKKRGTLKSERMRTATWISSRASMSLVKV